ncbi:hypothetical protein TSAR_002476, partial [Trichomalopsis sarcophagae]
FCYSGVFEVAEHEYRDDNALLGSWCAGKIRYSRISGATEHGHGAILKIIPEDDVDTVYPGHQIPRKRLSSLYSYTVTSKIPNQRVSTKYV